MVSVPQVNAQKPLAFSNESRTTTWQVCACWFSPFLGWRPSLVGWRPSLVGWFACWLSPLGAMQTSSGTCFEARMNHLNQPVQFVLTATHQVNHFWWARGIEIHTRTLKSGSHTGFGGTNCWQNLAIESAESK